MSCREFTGFLHDYLFGNLPAEERAECDKHLAEWPGCVAHLDSYRKTIQLGQSALAAPEDGRARALGAAGAGFARPCRRGFRRPVFLPKMPHAEYNQRLRRLAACCIASVPRVSKPVNRRRSAETA
jgi:putative zinc finger protein